MSSFSSLYARIKSGESNVARPYVKPVVEYAICKRCGAKVTRALESIEAHETTCGRQVVKVEDSGSVLEDPNISDCDNNIKVPIVFETELKRSFSATVMELPQTELCQQLSTEGRTLFTRALAEGSPGEAGRFMTTLSMASPARRGGHERAAEPYTKKALASAIVGWQRYSVAFGAGRMGLEFEYDARETRRLVVTHVTRDAAALGIRARDVLIGVGNRAVPCAIDPLAVHRHLVDCTRPVTLHFYRLHVRRKEHVAYTWPSPLYVDFSPIHIERTAGSNIAIGKNTVAAAASALWDHFLTRGDLNEQNEISSAHASPLNALKDSEMPMCQSKSELVIPAVCADPVRYGVDDDGSPIGADARCLLNAGARLALARALKPLLRSKPWELVYDSACDGMCLEALYARAGAAEHNQPQLLVCRDDLGHVAGAFLDEPVRNVGDYFGTGECFVFAVAGTSGPGVPAADILSDPDITIHRWVGPGDADKHFVTEILLPHSACASLCGPFRDPQNKENSFAPPDLSPIPYVANDMFVYATHDVLGFGSGGGGFALRLDEALEFGVSRPCATYGNQVSLFGCRENFPVQRVQIWSFTPQFRCQ